MRMRVIYLVFTKNRLCHSSSNKIKIQKTILTCWINTFKSCIQQNDIHTSSHRFLCSLPMQFSHHSVSNGFIDCHTEILWSKLVRSNWPIEIEMVVVQSMNKFNTWQKAVLSHTFPQISVDFILAISPKTWSNWHASEVRYIKQSPSIQIYRIVTFKKLVWQ